MVESPYLMESDEEALRLDLKTDVAVVEKQAVWAGIQRGMRIADIGCGSGKTTRKLQELAAPGGQAVGVDIAELRVKFATVNYGGPGIEFLCRDARKSMEDLGLFDFVWTRFLLEYYQHESFDLVSNIQKLVKPGGILCLIDLDYNCQSHFGIPERLQRTISAAMKLLEDRANFDPIVGRKLYTFMFDLGFEDIKIDVAGHHVIYGDLKDNDAFNWSKKIHAPRKIGYDFNEYPGGYEEFLEEFTVAFSDPRRFTYSPIICCSGRKPLIG